MELSKWITQFNDEEDLIFNMFNFYVTFVKRKENLISEMNRTSKDFKYSLNSEFDYDDRIVTFVLIREETKV